MVEKKPLTATAFIALLGALLIYLDSPSISGLGEYRYAFLVPIFTSIIAVASLYFIYSKLSEVME
ncbi:MAG: hypothetical protein ACI8Z7_000867 [Candidatus Nanohaloarchaea archaeon]|jgi:hypothetical protein